MDWQSLIADLTAAGLTQVEIAEACKCTQPTISELANGKTTHTRYEIGDGLRGLHAKHARAIAKARREKTRA